MLQFFRSNLRTIVFALALMLASSILWMMYLTARVSDTFPLGFPFQFFLSWGPCPPGNNCTEFNPIYLILDFLLWYAVSAFIFRRAGE